MRENNFETMTTTTAAEEAWTQRCYDSAKGLLVDEMRDSWFYGSTNPDSILYGGARIMLALVLQ
jgi:hypothetical protein